MIKDIPFRLHGPQLGLGRSTSDLHNIQTGNMPSETPKFAQAVHCCMCSTCCTDFGSHILSALL